MKIETKETKWEPIVVTIETREEAEDLFNSIDNWLGKATVDSLEKFLRTMIETKL